MQCVEFFSFSFSSFGDGHFYGKYYRCVEGQLLASLSTNYFNSYTVALYCIVEIRAMSFFGRMGIVIVFWFSFNFHNLLIHIPYDDE